MAGVESAVARPAPNPVLPARADDGGEEEEEEEEEEEDDDDDADRAGSEYILPGMTPARRAQSCASLTPWQ